MERQLELLSSHDKQLELLSSSSHSSLSSPSSLSSGQNLLMCGKVTPKMFEEVLTDKRFGHVVFSYPPYNRNDGYGDQALSHVASQGTTVDKVNEPLFKIVHHDTIAKLILHPKFVALRASIGMKPLFKSLDEIVMARARGTDGKNGEDGKVVILRKFLKGLADSGATKFAEHARNIEVYQTHMQNIPEHALVDLIAFNNWQSTIPGVNPNFREMLQYDDVLNIFGSRVTIKELADLGFLDGNVTNINNTVSWLSKSFIAIRVPGSLVDLVNGVRVCYKGTAFADLPIEDLIAKLMNDDFVLPPNSWVPDVVSVDGETDDDLVLALYKLVYPQRKLSLILQAPLNAPESILHFYKNLPNTDLKIVVDPDSSNLDKILAKGH
jgi:hypothetical protein